MQDYIKGAAPATAAERGEHVPPGNSLDHERLTYGYHGRDFSLEVRVCRGQSSALGSCDHSTFFRADRGERETTPAAGGNMPA